MTESKTLSKRRELRFWGWGYADESLSEQDEAAVDAMVKGGIAENPVVTEVPKLDEFDLPESRVAVPEGLARFCSTSVYDRLVHSYGKSLADTARMFLREVPNPPDVVAFPETEEDIVELLAFAAENNVAVIPYGGGTSVCGGIEAAVGDSYAGTICLDMQHLNRLIEVDEISRTARVQGGMLGPDIDAALKPHGLTLRHFPQSYQFSTIGGWVATRAGGHFATLYTHIDDLVESVRMVTPGGVVESRRLPGSGAGPSPDRMMIGSEGILGVITEVSVRLQHRPVWKATASVLFEDFLQGAEAVRALAQSGLYPTNCRLLDADEALFNGVVSEPAAVLVVGFESADHPVDAAMARALAIAADKGGRVDADSVDYREASSAGQGGANTEAESWKNAFLRAPYLRNRTMQYGLIADTFETAITWERMPAFYNGLKADIVEAIKTITGQDGLVSARFTHVYPDGACLYITFIAVGSLQGDYRQLLDRWCRIKAVANDKVIERGGTVTHHHAVGRDHRSGYEKQMPPLYLETLAAAKARLDPAGIMNPGVLIDPRDRQVGITGVMQDYH
ncbi:MAG: FAD-binding oxidoreductase [Halioglobus sp.]|nr:FAD-binding oxidoreductase [Halioglobus sp.]